MPDDELAGTVVLVAPERPVSHPLNQGEIGVITSSFIDEDGCVFVNFGTRHETKYSPRDLLVFKKPSVAHMKKMHNATKLEKTWQRALPMEQNQVSQMQLRIAELEQVNKNNLRMMLILAHDLRNPLGGITSLATTILAEEVLSEDSITMLNLIKTTGTHSLEMLSELLKTGLEEEDEPLDKQLLDFNALVFESIKLLRYKAKEKNQRILFTNENSPILISINYKNIWRVINNLIVNAIKFSYENQDIVVVLTNNKDDVVISIADQGIGIPVQEKDTIFEMFTAAKKKGTNGEPPFGLGLSISKRVIEKHNGKIWFESQPHSGTTFYISLPK